MDLSINDQVYQVDDASDRLLLWVLRDELGLIGTKFGCGIGICGSCTVHLDGVPTRAFPSSETRRIRSRAILSPACEPRRDTRTRSPSWTFTWLPATSTTAYIPGPSAGRAPAWLLLPIHLDSLRLKRAGSSSRAAQAGLFRVESRRITITKPPDFVKS